MADLTVLVVEHEPGAPVGRFGEALEQAGCLLDVRRPYAGDRLNGPDALEGVDGVVVLGGSAPAWDDVAAPWLPEARTVVRAAERAGVPLLGICLGHQLAAQALGGEVAPNPAGSTLAVLPVCWAGDARQDPLFADAGQLAVATHWNNDVVVRLPVGGRVTASSPDGAVQAARLGPSVWGVQFHPEAGPEIVDRWVREDGAPYAAAGVDVDRYLSDVRRHEPELAEGCRRLARCYHRLLRSRR